MSIPQSHQKQYLSSAFIRAIVAKSGHALTLTYESDYGVDGVVFQIENENGGYYSSGLLFNFQLKATWQCDIRNGEVVYDLDAAAYNKAARWKGFPPLVLILFRMPKDIDHWFHLEDDHLMLRHCAYWKLMEVEKTEATSKTRISIPKSHIFDEKAVEYLLSLSKGRCRA